MRYFDMTIREPCPVSFKSSSNITWCTRNQRKSVLFGLITDFFTSCLRARVSDIKMVYKSDDCLSNIIRTFFLEHAITWYFSCIVWVTVVFKWYNDYILVPTCSIFTILHATLWKPQLSNPLLSRGQHLLSGQLALSQVWSVNRGLTVTQRTS